MDKNGVEEEPSSPAESPVSEFEENASLSPVTRFRKRFTKRKDDLYELIKGKGKNGSMQETHPNKNSPAPEKEEDVSTMKKMTYEEMKGHVSTCMQLRTENKRKSTIVPRDQLTRKLKGKDPRDNFVSLEAVPGDILKKAKRRSEDLALTLERHMPFWPHQMTHTHPFDYSLVEPPVTDLPQSIIQPLMAMLDNDEPDSVKAYLIHPKYMQFEEAVIEDDEEDSGPSSQESNAISSGYYTGSLDDSEAGPSDLQDPYMFFNSNSEEDTKARGFN